MNKKTTIISLSTFVLFISGTAVIKNKVNSITSSNTGAYPSKNVAISSVPMPVAPADKIEVVHFHGTYQCWSCVTVGDYALKTIKEKFPEEYRSGKIVFKEINGELPENRNIVIKYQARGSSLFINAIHGEKEDIEEDVTVWRLVNNENQYIDYLERKIAGLLGK